jgi:hypothetical protein
MAVVARGIWLSRNKWLFDGVFLHPNAVFKEVVASLEDSRLFTNNEQAQISAGE